MRGFDVRTRLSYCGCACTQRLAGLQWAAMGHAVPGCGSFKLAGEKHLVPFEVIYQTDPRRSATVMLWLCFSKYEGFTILLPEES